MTEFKEGDKVTVREGAVSLFGHRPDPNEVRTVNGPAASAGYIALKPSRSSAQANIFRAADLVPHVETPAPLDPSKVKAGDTVTLSRGTSSVIAKVTHVQDFIHLEHLGRFRVKGLSSARTGGYAEYTLIAHTPAPEPEPEYEVGHVYEATVANVGRVQVVRVDPDMDADGPPLYPFPWFAPSKNDHYAEHAVSDVRPLVVIDPATVDRTQVAQVIRGEGELGTLDYMAAEAVLEHLGIEVPR